MDLISFSVPGNLLLMGEYTILEEKGLGLAIAINKRAFFSFKKSDSWRFFSKKKKIDDFSLIENRNDFVFKMFSYLSQNCFFNLDSFAYDIYIDTSNFFFNDGIKRGFGSSAVVAIGIVCGLFLIYNATNVVDKVKIFKYCLEAYRHSQGGIGSGYDIATSIFGGVIEFEGGFDPKCRQLGALEFNDFYLMRGLQAVKTTTSIYKYNKHRDSILDFILKCNLEMKKLVLNVRNSNSALISSLRRAKELGLAIGEAIGVSAALSSGFDHLLGQCDLIKALGAGNETFLVYRPNIKAFDLSKIIPIVLEHEGIKLESDEC
ncbi:phosphomevalonate kinase [Borreliella bissettiae]|uniref:GHMP kinases N terminal domain protein n=1 Tax=Borrelia bissettiae (strain DSM 17990 / CIP 109136 / DN127) TaxID=521010 RepID=G0AMC8_BORBD|nr:phosphomevalonate kinase [Borreliella bissettiae]AEL18854.1 GHMP kinases N terminal domain protein [Borreliella bissettiae DN127]MCD2401206.1 phosphomevalonate kinase [Borreliella bissettiae]WKD00090.1 phosphomevalonate kinase [Borreliella bissettiae]